MRGEYVRRTLGILAGVVAAIVGAAGIYAFLVEPRWLQVRRVRVHVRDLHPDLEGLSIGLLTDFHAGSRRSMRLTRRAASLLSEEGPALVALTGDFASPKVESFIPVFEQLAGLTPPLGVYAVPGNHDHKKGFARWGRELREHSSFIDLTNRSLIVPVGAARLCLTGVDDLAEGRPSLESLPEPKERDFTILLAHNPDQAEMARRASDRIDLVLSGHTHGGQIRLPGLGPVKSSVDHADLYEEGLRRRPWTQVYTSRGVGTVHLPARFLTRPEVTVLQLTGSGREAWR